MNTIFGIRHEDKYALERRVAVVPSQVKEMVEQQGLQAMVQTSPTRAFSDEAYLQAGAQVVSSLKECPVIFGVKEMPLSFFEKGKTYMFFSHVIKGQPYNMPMLRKMMDCGVNLIDHERVVDAQGRRLIFFGRFAGLAGMINSLWALGQRYQKLGIETPFRKLKQTHQYASLEEARCAIKAVGSEIAAHGLPSEITPLTVGVTGYGNVSKGAQEILDLLPFEELSPEELLHRDEKTTLSDHKVYKTLFMEKHLSVHKQSPERFDLQDYYQHPQDYEGVFEQYLPHLSCLMNCMYWDERYPRIVTKSYLKRCYAEGNPKLTVIGDVTCDPNGSVECTHKGTPIEDPVFVYNPFTDAPISGFEGKGILVMAVDILPSELPVEASQAFGEALMPYLKEIVTCDYTASFEALQLPSPIKEALILHKGALTPGYLYLKDYL
ncbi:MAG: hypothetical protein CSA95_02385 [Bacteroidetes bacterium]|nr:MAG: hypothetical protein CSA95_02385 [Bacteroidota bacterium]PIE87785.1 MAG: hypothetical protein CSA04_05230 [Bacteroidota bacterium]